MKLKNVFSILFSSLLAFTLCTFTSCDELEKEEDMLGKVIGTISDYADNSPIAGASVALSGATMNLMVTTNSNGKYEFVDLEPGTYDVIVNASGYERAMKSITVEAGRNSRCDMALTKEPIRVAIDPVALTFGPETNSLTFNIKNQSNNALTYSISGYPAFLSVSPAQAQIQAKGIQTVTVNVNRNAISKSETCQLTVNVGSDSYAVSININASDVTRTMEVSPTTLNFGETYTELSFYIRNKGTAGDLSWEIEQPSNSALSLNKRSGTTPMGGTTPVTVYLDRTRMTADFTTFINVNATDGSGSVPVIINALMPANGGNNNGGGGNSGGIAVRSGLQAYYTFDDGTASDLINGYDGVFHGDPSEAEDTPSRVGKAYKFLYNTKKQYFSIPYNPLQGFSTYTVSMWVKELAAGGVFRTGALHFDYTEGDKFFFWGNNSSGSYTTFNYDGKELGYAWHMITFSLSSSTNVVKLYIDGVLKSSSTLSWIYAASGTSIETSANMCLDNLRIYTRELTKDEVKEIYNSEL